MSSGALVKPAHYWVPEYYKTFGPEVGDLCAEAGYEPDPEQSLVLDAIFARRSDGLSAAFETGVVVGRQNIKTAVEIMAVLGWLYLFDTRLVVYSAHEFNTAMETFRNITEIITGSDLLRREVKRVVRNHGEESIELVTGARVMFKTRTKGGGRGLSGNKVVLDEAMFLKPAHLGALLPTMSAQPDPQVIYGSSPGMADSDVIRDVRDRGRAGGEPRLAWIEWCAPDPVTACDAGMACTHAKAAVGCGCDKPDYWLQSNPSLGKKRANGTGLTFEYVKAERRALPIGEFCRERMGWWDDPIDGASPLPLSAWFACSDKSSRITENSPLALGVDVSPDLASAAIGVAGWREDGMPHIEVAEHLPGTAWLEDRLLGIVDRRHPVAVSLDPSALAGAFEKRLRNAGLVVVAADKQPPMSRTRLVLAATREMAQACTGFANAVTNTELRHPDQANLNMAAEAARARPVAQAWAWKPTPGADITPLVATTLAYQGLVQFGKKEPPKPFALI